ncbi:MAG: AAA family ATPase [Promethearchaeota archaeon]
MAFQKEKKLKKMINLLKKGVDLGAIAQNVIQEAERRNDPDYLFNFVRNCVKKNKSKIIRPRSFESVFDELKKIYKEDENIIFARKSRTDVNTSKGCNMKLFLLTAAVRQINCEVECNGHKEPEDTMDMAVNRYIEGKHFKKIRDTLGTNCVYGFVSNSEIENQPGEINIYQRQDKPIYGCSILNSDFSGINEKFEQDKFIRKVKSLMENNGFSSDNTIFVLTGLRSTITEYGFKKLFESLRDEGYLGLLVEGYFPRCFQNGFKNWENLHSWLSNESDNLVISQSKKDVINRLANLEKLNINSEEIRIEVSTGDTKIDGFSALFCLIQKEYSDNIHIFKCLIASSLFVDKLEENLNLLEQEDFEGLSKIFGILSEGNTQSLWESWRQNFSYEERKILVKFALSGFDYESMLALHVKFKNNAIDYNRQSFYSKCLSNNMAYNNYFWTVKLFDWYDPLRRVNLWNKWGNYNNLLENEREQLRNSIKVWQNIDEKGDSSTLVDNVNSIEGTKKCEKCGKFTIDELKKAHRDIKSEIFQIIEGNLKNEINIDSNMNGLTDQGQAVEKFKRTGFLLLTGGPGTGKTYTLAKICKKVSEEAKRIIAVAPTGRAAVRLSLKLTQNDLMLMVR